MQCFRGFRKSPYYRSHYLKMSMCLSTLLKNQNLLCSQGYINGKFESGTLHMGDFDVTNPATGAVIATLPRMGASDIHRAAQISMDAWNKWKLTTAKERSKAISRMASLMLEYQYDLATLITLECGKPFAEARGEVLYAHSFYEYYSEEAKRVYGEVIPSPVRDRLTMTMKQPIGPAALITPWNFPCAMITRKVGAALAAGCTVVLKPAEQTPLSALALCVIAQEAGLPPGVMNCVTVSRDEVEEVGLAMCHSPLFRKLSFTGSTSVGKWLMRESACTMKKLSLELGGNAPFIVFEDADLDVAVKALMTSKFRNSGQTCIASTRVLVQESVMKQFCDILVDRVSKLKCGDGLEANTTVGPLIDERGLSKVERHVSECVRDGASVLIGGQRWSPPNVSNSTFYLPTVLTGVSPHSAPFTEETFGPVVPILSFQTEDEAIAIANNISVGLAAYACTKDLNRALRVSQSLECGMIGINEGAISAESVPFGGVKESGIGREGGKAGIEEYLEEKYVCFGGIKG